MNKKKEMEALIQKLNQAAEAYYNGKEIIPDYEYDRLYDRLALLEKEEGVVLEGSPTQNTGYQTVENLPKVTHEFPALSLDKTKNAALFVPVFDVRDHIAVVMWKMDGSTVIATYRKGFLTCAATRGNGIVGSDISHNAPFIKGLPQHIPFQGNLVVRGEACMSYAAFNRINQGLPAEEQYKNPRNLANASLSLLSSEEMSHREIVFHAFKLVYMDTQEEEANQRSFVQDMSCLKKMGFHTVEYQACSVNAKASQTLPDLIEVINDFSSRATQMPYPVDGLVVAANDVAYAESQPGTGHNPHKLVGYALKWQDETAETVLRKIEWQASRTGLLNPVAYFDPVELEGTTVTRATLHNITYIVEHDLRVGDRITVYKANKIIPKIAENLEKREEKLNIENGVDCYDLPTACPVCGGKAELVDEVGSGSYVALCKNPQCPAKMIGSFVHFVSRDCINVIGLSEATIEKLVDCGFVREYADFWKLEQYKQQITEMDGFGEKSYQKLQNELKKAQKTTFVQLINALGIPNIGKGQAKLLYQHYSESLVTGADMVKTFFAQAMDADYPFDEIKEFGAILNRDIHAWAMAHPDASGQEEKGEISRLLSVIEVVDRLVPEKKERKTSGIEGMTFVITGDVHVFRNRAELQRKIEELGGKTTGSVSKSTSYLINNEAASQSAKYQKAQKLGIPILTEEDFLKLLEQKSNN